MSTLNKREFAKVINEVTDVKSVAEAERQIDNVITGLKAAVANGNGVSIIGAFSVKIVDVPKKEGKVGNRPYVKEAHRKAKMKISSSLPVG